MITSSNLDRTFIPHAINQAKEFNKIALGAQM